MGKVSGEIPYRDSDDEEAELFPFGQWLFKTIVRESQGDDEWGDWRVLREKNSPRHLYLWRRSLEEPGKGADHFRDKEHLHLIDQDGDVDISTKHPRALEIGPGGTYEKPTAADKEPLHLTGTKALNSGASRPITVCTRNEPPPEVVEWQRVLIADLRRAAAQWLQEVGTSNQLKEFRS